jgi:hypothetical protein
MSMFLKRMYCLSLVLVSLCFVNVSHGQWWNPKSWVKGQRAKRADILIVTSNHIKSRMLAESIQSYTKQPVLLLPTGNETEDMFLLLPDGESDEIDRDDFVRFVDFLQPRNVLFLGDENYVPSEFIEEIKDVVGSWSVAGNNWELIAFSVGDMLKLKNLGFDYLVYLNQLDSSGHIKPPASTEEYGGFSTKKKFWKQSSSE